MSDNAVVFQGHQREAPKRYYGRIWQMPSWRDNFSGKVECKICQIKESLEKYVSNQRLSVLQWEALH